MEWIDILALAIGGFIAIAVIREMRIYASARIRSQAVQYKNEQKKNQVGDFFTMLTVARNQLVSMRDDQKAKGVTDDQLKGINRNIYITDLMLNNRTWIELGWPLAEPLIKAGFKSVTRAIS